MHIFFSFDVEIFHRFSFIHSASSTMFFLPSIYNFCLCAVREGAAKWKREMYLQLNCVFCTNKAHFFIAKYWKALSGYVCVSGWGSGVNILWNYVLYAVSVFWLYKINGFDLGKLFNEASRRNMSLMHLHTIYDLVFHNTYPWLHLVLPCHVNYIHI